MPSSKKIFSDYDALFAFDLNEEEYAWYWNQITTLLDAFGAYHPEGWNQLATQYKVARHPYNNNEKILFYLEKASAAGYEPALIKYGNYLQRGSGVPQNKEKAEELFSRVKSKAGLEELQIIKAFENPDTAAEIVAALEAGNPEESNLPDLYYLHAYLADTNKNYAEAEKYYTKRISLLSHHYVYYRLACLKEKKRTENPDDTAEILALLEKSFKSYPNQDTAEALYSCYYESGTEWQDNEKLIYIFEKGVQYGIGYCAYELALILLNNEKYKDIEKGLHYLDQAIALEYHNAYLSKARHYRDGNILEKDLRKCTQLLEEVLELGCYYAWIHFGYMYETGQTEDNIPDYTKALEYYQKAAGKEEVEGYEKTGYFYRNGYGTEKDPEKAREYYAKAIELNSDYARVELGIMYMNGEGGAGDTDKGFTLFSEAAANNYPSGQYFLGLAYRKGLGTPENPEKAFEQFLTAVNNGHSWALYELAICYEEAYGTEKDLPKALEYYEKAAGKNIMEACEKAGLFYRNGNEVGTDPVKAREYYAKAISLNSDFARIELGTMCVYGEGEDRDAEKGLTLFSEAAANNYSPGHYFLGLAYKRGWGVAENPDKSFEHFQTAAGAGHIWAHVELGLCYDQAYGVERDKAKALECMLRAAEKNIPFAQYKAGEYYLYGNDKVTVNYEEALQWLTKAAGNNYPNAFLELGNYYFYRYNKTNEPEKSYEFFEKAARSGCINEGLGLCLQWGYGVEKNEGEGFKYLLKGAEDGYIRAMFYTGRCYMYGIGIQENHEEAFRWFNQAAGYNHLFSIYFKGRMLVEGDGTPPDIEEGVECIKRAAERGNRDAMYELANYYLLGKGVAADDETAWEWFEKAAAKGHKESMKITGKSQRK
ncbi:MAG: hypothetical protein LUH15_00075 [Tannerellaceae bacterium]|nr:hypothetical protein [Tannerellaceae bacterium]